MARATLILSFSTIFLFCSISSHAAIIHVSASTGTNSSQCGSASSPCQTISYAVNVIASTGTEANTIKISTGTYSSLHLTGPVLQLSLQGGWNDTFTTHTCEPGQTVLTGVDWPHLHIYATTGVMSTVNVQCLGFNGDGGTAPLGVSVRADAPGAEINFTMERCSIESYGTHGVVIWALNGGEITADIQHTVVRDNVQTNHTGQGGAGMNVAVNPGSRAMITLRKNMFLNNTCSAAGGGIAFQRERGGTITAHLENNIISGNTSSSLGGAIYAWFEPESGDSGDLEIQLTNNTITNNRSYDVAGGIALQSSLGGIYATLRNNIIWGNTSQLGLGQDIYLEEPDWPGADPGIDADYSIIGDVEVVSGNYVDGAHNRNIDPKIDGTFHLISGSPAIDNGICGWRMPVIPYSLYVRVAPYDDFEGNNRPGIGETTGCDIGADEYLEFPWELFLPAIIHHEAK